MEGVDVLSPPKALVSKIPVRCWTAEELETGNDFRVRTCRVSDAFSSDSEPAGKDSEVQQDAYTLSQSPLSRAAAAGDVATLKQLLAGGAASWRLDPSPPPPAERRVAGAARLDASAWAHVATDRILLHHAAFTAAMHGHAAALQVLSAGGVPLHREAALDLLPVAVSSGTEEAVKLLLGKLEGPLPHDLGTALLATAAASAAVEVVATLLAAGADTTASAAPLLAALRVPARHRAAPWPARACPGARIQDGRALAVLEQLVAAGANPTATDSDGTCALQRAIEHESVGLAAGMAATLLHAGASANAKVMGTNAANTGSAAGSSSSVGSTSLTPPVPLLHFAVRRACGARAAAAGSALLAAMLSGGADVSAVDGAGDTALHIVCFEHARNRQIGEPLLHALLDAGARIDVCNNAGVTPLAVLSQHSPRLAVAVLQQSPLMDRSLFPSLLAAGNKDLARCMMDAATVDDVAWCLSSDPAALEHAATLGCLGFVQHALNMPGDSALGGVAKGMGPQLLISAVMSRRLAVVEELLSAGVPVSNEALAASAKVQFWQAFTPLWRAASPLVHAVTAGEVLAHMSNPLALAPVDFTMCVYKATPPAGVTDEAVDAVAEFVLGAKTSAHGLGGVGDTAGGLVRPGMTAFSMQAWLARGDKGPAPPLFGAALARRWNVASLLLRAGASPNTAARFAFYECKAGVWQRSSRAVALPAGHRWHQAATPLMAAIMQGDAPMQALLLRHGASLAGVAVAAAFTDGGAGTGRWLELGAPAEEFAEVADSMPVSGQRQIFRAAAEAGLARRRALVLLALQRAACQVGCGDRDRYFPAGVLQTISRLSGLILPPPVSAQQQDSQ